jgi:hypothetical protein
MGLLLGRLGRRSRSSPGLVRGEVFLRLPDATDVDGATAHAASEALTVSSSLLWFGLARARRRSQIELPGGATGIVLDVRKGHEDALVRRLEAWLIDELRLYGAMTGRRRDSALAVARHVQSWSVIDSLQERQVEGRLDVFVACRVPLYWPAAGPADQSMIRGPYASIADGGEAAQILLVDTGIDEHWLSRHVPGFDPSRLRWLPAPRRTKAGPYEMSRRAGDRRVGGHGTAMATAIWERAPQAIIAALPALEPELGAGTPGTIVAFAIQIAHGERELRQVNLSLEADPDAHEQAKLFETSANMNFGLDSMLRRGAVVVAAVGNAHPADIGLGWPAHVRGVIAVGAVYRDGRGFMRCPDSRYDPAAVPESSNLWVEDGGHLENGRVVTPAIVVDGVNYAGSSIACARASGSIAAWWSAHEEANRKPPSVKETWDRLLAVSHEGLQALPFAERGHGWARPQAPS